MPTSVKDILDKFGLKVYQTVRWNNPIATEKHGIYIISFSNDMNYLPVNKYDIAFSEEQINLWQKNAPHMSLHNKPVSNEELKTHLRKFWLADETILYIGKAEKQYLSDRIAQFYKHKVGRKSPNKGGYWLKLLENLNRLYIHIIVIKNENPSIIEENMLQYFIENVSPLTKGLIQDNELCLPFANLQLRSRVVKKHGLKKHVM